MISGRVSAWLRQLIMHGGNKNNRPFESFGETIPTVTYTPGKLHFDAIQVRMRPQQSWCIVEFLWMGHVVYYVDIPCTDYPMPLNGSIPITFTE